MMANYDEMCKQISVALQDAGTYVAKLEYSYQSELYGTFDELNSWEVLEFDGDTITWFNDWYEGQDNCYCEDIISIETLIKAYFNVQEICGLCGWPEDNWLQVVDILGIK